MSERCIDASVAVTWFINGREKSRVSFNNAKFMMPPTLRWRSCVAVSFGRQTSYFMMPYTQR